MSAKAIGRSKEGPSLRTSAGERFTSSRPAGKAKPELKMAARTRSRASVSARSGRPMIAMAGVPGELSASTRTTYPSIPSIAAEKASESTPLHHDAPGWR